MKNMKNPETCHQARKTPVTTQFNRFRVRFIATVCAAMTAGFVLTGQGQNLLQNAGFETGALSPYWQKVGVVATYATPETLLPHSGTYALWNQGNYQNIINGVATGANGYNNYVYQTLSCFPGATYSADAWFTQFVDSPTNGITGGGEGGDATVGGFTTGLFGANDVTGYWEDGWLEVQFLDATGTNILADYRSTIIDPPYVANLVAIGNTVTNRNFINTLGHTNYVIYLAWGNYPVTNQYNPTTLTNAGPNQDPSLNDPIASGEGTTWNVITNTLGPGQNMVAPAGAVTVEFRVSLYQHSYACGAPWWDDCELIQVGGPAPSVINNVWPDGSQYFNSTATNFTFSVVSAATGGAALPTNAPANIHVVVNGVDESAGLQFSGNSTNWNVTLPNSLVFDAIYTVSVTVTNSLNLVTANTYNFDTFPTNCLIVSSEDYDFTNGMFFDNPIPWSIPTNNCYTGLGGVWGVDINTYGAPGALPQYSVQLVRADGCVATALTPDTQLPLYQAENILSLAAGLGPVKNVALSYNFAGNWENYTRTVYPTNYCEVYARMSFGAGGGAEYLNQLTSGYGTTNQTTNVLGEFHYANSTGANYIWVPLTYGASASPVALKLPPVAGMGATNTLQLLAGTGAPGVAFMIFVPLSSALGIPPFISNPSLPAQPVFCYGTSNITYSVYSLTTNILSSQIYAYLDGQNVSSTATCTMVGTGGTNWTVSVPLPPGQQIHTFYLGAVDAVGLSNSISPVFFDTFSQTNFMIEAEDFDFNGGQFITNPIPTGAYVNGAYPAYAYSIANSYFLYPAGNNNNAAIDGVDLTTPGPNSPGGPDAGETEIYRPSEDAGTQVATDFLRGKFYHTNGDNSVTVFNDFNLGFWDPGQWVNYSSLFPTNTYNVWGRLASAGAYSGLSLSLVTSGVGTTNQTTQLLGTFSDPNANGWQAWDWVPLLNTNGQMAVVSLGGTNTLQANNTTAGDVNANFYMFVPAVIAPQAVHLSVSSAGSTISIQFPTQNGLSYTVLYSSSLAVPRSSWSTLTTISGDGTVKTATYTMGSSPRYYVVKVQ